jgi:hypothetical protein
MKAIQQILSEISLNQIISEYKQGGFSEKTNKVVNEKNLNLEVVEYSDIFEVNFIDDNDDIIESFTVKI